MRFLLYILLSGFILFTACAEKNQSSIPQMDFETFEPLLQKDNDTVYVVNFWATWCKPCVQELPYFERLNNIYLNKKVKVVLVSLDFPDKLETVIKPFVIEKNIKSQVIHLTDVNANNWIDKVSPEWSGAIPATIIYKGNEKVFTEGSMTFEELKNIVESKL